MISLKEIKKALVRELKTIEDIPIFTDEIGKLKTPSFLILIDPLSTKFVDPQRKDRILLVDICYFPKTPDQDSFYTIMDKLESDFCTSLYVENDEDERYFLIGETKLSSIDKVLHFTFDLSFRDFKEIPETSVYMEELEIHKEAKGWLEDYQKL